MCHRRGTSPSPMRKSDKLMNYWECRGRQTKSESHASQSLLHPICSQRIPPKDWFIVNAAWHPVWGRKRVVDKGTENGGTGSSICQEYEQKQFVGQVPTVVILPLTKIPHTWAWVMAFHQTQNKDKLAHLTVEDCQRHHSHLFISQSFKRPHYWDIAAYLMISLHEFI